MGSKELFFYELEGRGYIFQNKKWDEAKHGFEDDMLNMAWEMWSSAKHRAKAQAVPEWISVEDELPTPNKTFSDAVIAWDGICIRRIPLCLFNSASEVTHWMPIPQPPKAQEQKG